MWNPPLLDEELGLRGSALYEAAELFAELITAGARTICFMKSRKGVELILRHAVDRLEPELAERIAPYRAGYTPGPAPRDRAAADAPASCSGSSRPTRSSWGSTSASSTPRSASRSRARSPASGRCGGGPGRRGRGLAVYIAGEDALDQFFCRHPGEFLSRPVEAAILDPDSPEIYAEHLLCAAHEAPLSDADAPFLGEGWRAGAEQLDRSRDAPRARHRLRPHAGRRLPGGARGAALRLGGQLRPDRRRARARCSARSRPRAPTRPIHEGAIYLHLGRSYQVLELDLDSRRALLEPFSGDYFTQAKRESMTYIERLHERRDALGVTLSFGSVVYSETVLGYQRKGLQDHQVIDFQALDLPTVEFQTRALWYELDELLAAEPFPAEQLLGALHALEHGQIAVLPLIAMCDRWDIGGLSTNAHPQTGWPDDLHLRRAPGRRRDHPPRLRPVRPAGRPTPSG